MVCGRSELQGSPRYNRAPNEDSKEDGICKDSLEGGGGEREGGHSTVPLSPPSFVAGFFLNFSHQVARDTFADGGDPYWVTDGAEGTSAVVIFFPPSETCLSFSRFLSLECASVR